MLLLPAIPKSWKNNLSDVPQFENNHLYFLNRLSSKEIYNFLIAQKEEQTSSKLYYQKKFNDSNLDWKNIYLLVRISYYYVLFSLNY